VGNRQSSEKIAIFRDFFTGHPDVYGTYDPVTGRAKQVKAPVTEAIFLAHLTGRQPYGVYLLYNDRIRSIAVDMDTDDRLIPMDFVSLASHYGFEAYIERSKSKGYHVWLFFTQAGVLAAKARTVIKHLLEEMERPDIEVFPKQDRLSQTVQYGNFINAPLFGQLVPKGRTVFIDPTSFKPYPDQWDFLDSVKRYTESDLDEIIELNELCLPSQPDTSVLTPIEPNNNAYPLPLCAQKMLEKGVSEFQRVSCFRLAVHLKRLGIPCDIAISALIKWAEKNCPVEGKQRISEKEIIEQAVSAYKKNYQGYGCDSEAVAPFCESRCPLYSKSRSLRN